jgi:cyclase
MKNTFGAIAIVAALVVNPARAQEDPTVRALSEKWPEIVKIDGIEIVPVQKNVYMLVGGGANVTLQIGEEGAMLVDAGSAGNAEKLIAAVRNLTRKPLRFLVNASADPDHVGGNGGIVAAAGGPTGIVAGALGRPANAGILTIAHQDAVNRMTSGAAPLKGDAVPVSTFFTEKKEFYANGEAVQLFYQPKAHSGGDLVVFFRASDVVSAGDVFRTDSYPVLDVGTGATLQGEIDALNLIIDLAIPERNQMGGTRIVPGHGHLCNESDVVEYRDMLTIIRDRVREMLKKDMTLKQVRTARPTLEYDGIYGRREEMSGDKFIEIVYNDLKGNTGNAKRATKE